MLLDSVLFAFPSAIAGYSLAFLIFNRIYHLEFSATNFIPGFVATWLIMTAQAMIFGSKLNYFIAPIATSILVLVAVKIITGSRHASANEASGDGTTPLMGAAMLGKVKQIQELISAGANIDAADERGWTSLMYAASRNEIEAVEILLRHGANPSLRSNDNRTAIEIAQSKDNVDVVTAIQRTVSQ